MMLLLAVADNNRNSAAVEHYNHSIASQLVEAPVGHRAQGTMGEEVVNDVDQIGGT